MNLTRDALYVVGDIIGKAQRGTWTPRRAEAVANRLGVGPLARTPSTLMYDPLTEAFWTMPMAVAWIAWRTSDAVRDAWNSYRENCWDWHFRRSRLGFDGPIEEGYFLEARPRISMQHLVLADTYDRATGEQPETRQMSPAEAEAALVMALQIGCFSATGVTAPDETRVAIPMVEWIDLKCFSEKDRDYYSANALRQGSVGRYDNVMVDSRAITKLWLLPKPRGLLPPLMRPDGPGYIPLFCAAQWIATQGGASNFDPEKTDHWRSAYRELLDHVSSGQVRISGVHNNARESIDGVVFAGCQVDYPYSDAALDIGFSETYYLQSYPYIDDEHWRRGINDSFTNRHDVRWKELMVAKADVAHFWPFESNPPAKSGAPGRPTSMHLIVAEFEERAARGDTEATLSKQASVLAEWLVQRHRNCPPAGRKAIENGIRIAFHKAKQA
ncbi:hypothetical protein NKI89_01880 [Mesorhizobium sp. M0309]|uniref:hypothetical protein n=1 Tax=Mesorhizobium sp. M0309 TaxID=2956933 RepID=UPI003337B7FE